MLLNNDQNSIKYKILNLNWHIVFLIFTLSLIGIFMLYSAAGAKFENWLVKQIIYLIIFFPIMIIIAIIDIKFWFKTSYLAYFCGVILLIIVSIKGYNSMGATRWFKIFNITIQPSEITKIIYRISFGEIFLHN